MGFVLAGLLVQPCQGKIDWRKHSKDGLATFATALVSGFMANKLFMGYQAPAYIKLQAIDKEIADIYANDNLSFDEILEKAEEKEDTKKGLRQQIDNQIASYKVKTIVGCGAAVGSLAFLVQSWMKPSSVRLSHIKTSPKQLMSRFFSSASYGIAASGAAFAVTNIWRNDLFKTADRRNSKGAIAKLLGITALVVGTKVIAHWFNSKGTQENIIEILKNWSIISQEKNLNDTYLMDLSKKVNAGECLSAIEKNEAKNHLKILGFNDDMTGLLVKKSSKLII